MIKRLLKKLYKKIYKTNDFARSIMINDLINNFSFKKLLINLKGFKEETWIECDLKNKNYKEYLSDRDYMNMHPINGRYSMWIDDKLTLKYMLAGNPKLRNIMPDYYWHIDEEGNIFELMDLEKEKLSLIDQKDRIIELLKKKKKLVLKLFSGTLGQGFYKIEYLNKYIYINEKEYSEVEFKKFIDNMRGYLITEFINPSNEFIKYSIQTANTIRYVGGNFQGNIKMLIGWIRLGTKKTKILENYEEGGIRCYFNEKGEFNQGYIFNEETKKDVIIKSHPDTNETLNAKIPDFNKLEDIVKEIFKYLPQLKYCGFDFVYTNKNEYKIFEINSLSGLNALQKEGSILKSKYGDFYLERLKK